MHQDSSIAFKLGRSLHKMQHACSSINPFASHAASGSGSSSSSRLSPYMQRLLFFILAAVLVVTGIQVWGSLSSKGINPVSLKMQQQELQQQQQAEYQQQQQQTDHEQGQQQQQEQPTGPKGNAIAAAAKTAVGGIIMPDTVTQIQAALTGRTKSIAEHGPIKAIATPLDCASALKAREGKVVQTLQYAEPGGKLLHLDMQSKTIMNWITSVSPDEKKVHELFRYLFKSGCAQGKVFVDVGANAGFYSLVAGVYGCQVLLFDPQPLCVDLIRQNLCMNQQYPVIAEGKVAIVGRPVADVAKNISMTGIGVCEGTFSVDKQAKQASSSLVTPAAGAGSGKVFFRETVSLDDMLLGLHNGGLELHVIKVDTEGYEVPVLRSMKKLLAAKKLHHIVVEVTPLFWARDGVERESVYTEFLPFFAAGCSIQRVLDVKFTLGNTSGDPSVTSSSDTLLDTAEKLHEYLVKREFVQEDLYINCSGL